MPSVQPLSVSPDDRSTNSTLTPGQIFEDRFEIISVLGKGGVGVVYKAKHLRMEKIVAIKTLRSAVVSDDEESFRRFEQEAKTASALNHTNIVSIFDFGKTTAGLVYLVMEYLGDKTLESVLIAERYLDFERFANIASQICDGLQHAHKKGIIHRDLKPSNIMLVPADDDGEADASGETRHDNVKIVDFGLAKLTAIENSQHLTKTGTIVGTPLYMSPEQCRGLELDTRSDIYSLGCVLYTTLTGHLPIHGATALDTLYQHTVVMPRRFTEVCPGLVFPPQLEKVIFKALAKDPDERQQSALELREEIVKAVADPAYRRSIADSVNRKIAFMRSSLPLEKAARDDSGSFQSIDQSQSRLQNDLELAEIQDQSDTVRTPPDGISAHAPKFDSSSISPVLKVDPLKKGGELLDVEKGKLSEAEGAKKPDEIDKKSAPAKLTDSPNRDPLQLSPKPVPAPNPWPSVAVLLLLVCGGVAFFNSGKIKTTASDTVKNPFVVQSGKTSSETAETAARATLLLRRFSNSNLSGSKTEVENPFYRDDYPGFKSKFIKGHALDSRTLSQRIAAITGTDTASSKAGLSGTNLSGTSFPSISPFRDTTGKPFANLSLSPSSEEMVMASAIARQQYSEKNWSNAAAGFERTLRLQRVIFPNEEQRQFTTLAYLVDCRSRLNAEKQAVANLVTALQIFRSNQNLVTSSVSSGSDASEVWTIMTRACFRMAMSNNSLNDYKWEIFFYDLARQSWKGPTNTDGFRQLTLDHCLALERAGKSAEAATIRSSLR